MNFAAPGARAVLCFLNWSQESTLSDWRVNTDRRKVFGYLALLLLFDNKQYKTVNFHWIESRESRPGQLGPFALCQRCNNILTDVIFRCNFLCVQFSPLSISATLIQWWASVSGLLLAWNVGSVSAQSWSVPDPLICHKQIHRHSTNWTI